MDRPMAKTGDRITFKPEFREESDESFEFIAMEDESEDRRSLKITVLGTGLFLNPIQTIDVNTIATVTPTAIGQSQAERDRDVANAMKCELCGELPIGGHGLVRVNGEMRDCPNAGSMRTKAPRCFGAEDENGKALCPNDPVRDVAFKAPGSDEWHLTQWCDDCRAQARADGYTTYTWTDIIGHCSRSCGKNFRASVESIESARGAAYGELTDIEVVEGWDFCLNCLEDGDIPGEHDVPAILTHTPFATGVQIAGLTPADVFAIAAALDVACDDAHEPYPGLRAAQEKVAKVLGELRALGYEPSRG